MEKFTAHHTNPNAYKPDWAFLVNSKRGNKFMNEMVENQVKNRCRNYTDHGDVVVTDASGVSRTITITENYTVAA